MLKKSLFVLGLGLLTPFAAFAYQAPAPITVEAPTVLGAGEVDFTRPSVLEGSFSVNTTSGEDAFVTAGDVANGGEGYGFAIHDDVVFLVSTDGSTSYRYPIGFLFPGQAIHFRAKYTPGDGLRVDTDSVSSAFSQYSRSLMNVLQRTHLAPAFSATAQKSIVTVGSWSYTE